MVLKFKHLAILTFINITFLGNIYAQENEVGKLTMNQGSALILRGEESKSVKSPDTFLVYKKDTIQTLPDSTGMVILGEKGETDHFVLKEKTTFIIEEFLPEKSLYRILSGKVRSLINVFDKEKKVRLETSVAIIAVKGTDFLVEVPNSEVTQITTFEGTVAFSNRWGDIQEIIDIAAGFRSIIISENIPYTPLALSYESIQESLRSAPLSSKSIIRINPDDPQLLLEKNNLEFRKYQFDRITERAARIKGGLVEVFVDFE